MDWLKNSNRLYLQSSLLADTSLVHAFTGRQGGVSTGNITGLNLGFRVEDNPASVMENYRLVGEDLGLQLENTVLAKQTHTNHIRIITREDAGKGLFRESDITDTDGLMTKERGIPLVVFSADCVPILLYDPKTPAIAAIHAGWRGTEKAIAKNAVAMMQEHFGSDPQDILVAIGPSIGPCCFTFGEDATEHFPQNFCKPLSQGKFLVDIWSVNREQLQNQGVLPEHIDISGLCTVCHQDKFYSYRTHKEHTGRQGAIIMLR